MLVMISAPKPQPCPSWCTGEESLSEDPRDGFHHWGPVAAIELTHSERTDRTDVLTAALCAFVPSRDGAPGPARVELCLNKSVAIELTPAEARQVAGILLDLSAVAEAART
jgi:Domain of unknown function (DUF6907)